MLKPNEWDIKPPRKEKLFFDAAKKGDIKTLKSSLASGVDVNALDKRKIPTNRTALMHAAENGHIDVVKVLIAANAKINAVDKGIAVDCPGGNTALILAIKECHIDIANLLLNVGASPKTKGGGTTVLNSAVESGNLDLTKRLLSFGANPNQSDAFRHTPMSLAVQNKNSQIVKLLLDSGVSPNARAPGGSSIFVSAVYTGHLEICKMLAGRGANPNLSDEENFTPLMMACRCLHKNIIEFLLTLKVRVNEKDSMGRTALDIVHWMQEPPDFAPNVLKRLIALGQITIHSPELLKNIVNLLRKAGGKTAKELDQSKQLRAPASPR